ncbi:MGDG synthase family glycosyltransferase [Clostridium thermarum]|uniref:MGDG synthase family glycosyltransferase n=1 Tax=Clostridium thermarum TaxID=1716543 RepID=UPI00111F78AF|nr:glycosyltransferase [Clostridium thermarum]
MRTLILSVSAGGGHVKAAEAIELYVKLDNPENEVMLVDTIKYINPILDKVVIGGYLKSLKFSPFLFGKLYDLAENGESIANFSNKVNEIIIHKLIPLIEDYAPDVIVTTHPFSTEMISILKGKGKIHIPVAAILTDYAPHSFWIHPNIDAYIVSTEEMVDEMVRRGVERAILHPLGIPVIPGFTKVFPREETLESLGLNPQKPTVLLMGGSLGMGKITALYEELQQTETDLQIIVITGSNHKLFSRLSDEKNTCIKHTRIIGYTTEVNRYMQACDLLITKPGGLTITEALICGVPLALFSAIPGQEEKNAEFLIKNHLAVDLGDGKYCRNIIDSLLSSSDRLMEMKNNCSKFAKPNSGYAIKKLLYSLIKES